MSLRDRVLAPAEFARVVEDPAALDRYAQDDELPFCTVVEPLLLADGVYKGRTKLDWAHFRAGWEAIVVAKRLPIVGLDEACLQRALFERPEDALHMVIGIWAPANDASLGPDRTVRRLILRPSEETWWDDDCFEAMEAWP